MNAVKVWDLRTRVFHWVNFLSVVSLIIVSFFMMYKKELGISGDEAKIALKQLHVIIGYIFVTNLLIRIIGFFTSGFYSRWSQVFPGRGYFSRLKAFMANPQQQYAGHNPKGQLAVALMFLLFLILATTGLIRAATDVYMPPFGSIVTDYIVEEGVAPESLIPYDNTGVNAERLAEVRSFKKNFGRVHKYAAYSLMAIILLHIFAVVYTEVRHQRGIISAMFSGYKYFDKAPVDPPR